MNTTADPALILTNEFERRRQKNPRYSLRAFARHLGLPAGRLSEILSRKRRITAQMGESISEKLWLSLEERQEWLRCWNQEERVSKPKFELVPNDVFYLISDPIHFEILSLLETKCAQSNSTWISKKIRASKFEVNQALERLLRLEFLKKLGSKLQLTKGGLKTTQDVPSAAIRRFHRLVLERALDSLESDAVDARDFSAITMAIDPMNLGKAKKMIQDFRRKLCTLLEDGTKTEVYRLSIQLTPVTKKGMGK